MAKRDTLKRAWVVLQFISNRSFPTLEDIQQRLLQHDLDVSNRTLQRDLEALRDTFSISVEYDQQQKGYFIDGEASLDLSGFMHFLEMANTSSVLMESLQESQETLKYLSFESDSISRGTEHLALFLEAVRKQLAVVFNHENFDTGKTTEHVIRPYHLREYQSRWYVSGIIEDEKLRTFGLDRITQPRLNGKGFKSDTSIDMKAKFSDVVGLTYSDGEPEDVVLRVTTYQAKYVSSLPLHPSQEIIERTADFVRFRIRVIPNYELIQKILMLGKEAAVESPSSFKAKIGRIVTEMAEKYTSL